MNAKKFVANYGTYDQEAFAKLLYLNTRKLRIQFELNKYKYEQSQLRQTIAQNKLRMEKAAACVLKRRRPRRTWTLNRYGSFWEKDVANNDDAFFKEAFRMESSTFDILVDYMKGLERQDTNFRACIPLPKRVAIALYALGSSAEYRTVGLLFGVSKASVCNILNEFCREVWRVLASEYLTPNFLTEENIEECVKGFEVLGFPQCLGAMDGCHVEIRPKSEDAVDYYNYKGWYSTNLFALVDYRYRFLYINVGSPGRCHDSTIFEESNLKSMLQSDILTQKAKEINDVKVPVVVLGDSAFRLSESIMKPYPFSTTSSKQQKAFNYGLSKCRRVVENAFGQLKARFRRIGKGIDNEIVNVNAILKCAYVLHNFLNEHNSAINQKWIAEQQQYEDINKNLQSSQRDVFVNDFNPDFETIRSAIASFLCSQAFDDDASVGKNDEDEILLNSSRYSTSSH